MHDDPVRALITRLERRAAAYVAAMRPGLGPEALGALEERLGAGELPAALRGLYGWREPAGRGARATAPGEAWALLSSEEMVAARAEVLRLPGADGRWVPFLGDGGGDWLCAVAGGEGVVEVSRGVTGRPLRFASVERWAALTAEGLERGLLSVSRDGGLLAPDPFAWEGFLLRENPGFAVGDAEEPEVAAAPPRGGAAALLQRLATGLGTLGLVGLAILARVFRGQLPRRGFAALLLAFGLAGVFLLAAQLIGRGGGAAAARAEDPLEEEERARRAPPRA